MLQAKPSLYHVTLFSSASCRWCMILAKRIIGWTAPKTCRFGQLGYFPRVFLAAAVFSVCRLYSRTVRGDMSAGTLVDNTLVGMTGCVGICTEASRMDRWSKNLYNAMRCDGMCTARLDWDPFSSFRVSVGMFCRQRTEKGGRSAPARPTVRRIWGDLWGALKTLERKWTKRGVKPPVQVWIFWIGQSAVKGQETVRHNWSANSIVGADYKSTSIQFWIKTIFCHLHFLK